MNWQINSRVWRIRLCINAFLAIEAAAVPTFIAGSALAGIIYWNRRFALQEWLTPTAAFLLIVSVGFWTYRQCARRWFTRKDTLAFIDTQLGLEAALSAEEEWNLKHSLTALPHRGTLHLKLTGVWGWLVGSAVSLWLACVLPLPQADQKPKFDHVELPPALAQTEELIEHLEEMEALDQSTVETFKEEVANLTTMPRDELYSHAGLEAADVLFERVQSSARDLSNNLAETSYALENEVPRGQYEELQQTLETMKNNRLQVNQQLAENMASVDCKNGSCKLTPEQLKDLARQLKKASGKLNEMCQTAQGLSPVINPNDYLQEKTGEQNSGSGNRSGPEAGYGGVNRGRDDAPLVFGQKIESLTDGSSESISATDLSRAALGDVTETTVSAPEQQEVAPVSSQSKQATSKARGGVTVWRDDLVPQEREAMKAYFQ